MSRILHAGYVFECEEVQIAFDPIFENPFSRNCHAFPEVCFDQEQIKKLQFAAVFISHFHDDHCSLESLNFLDRQTPIYIYCLYEELLEMIRALGFTRVHALQLGQAVSVGPFVVTPHRALDAEVDSLFQVQAAGFNILNVVDSWIDYATLDLLVRRAPWDLVLWPFQTMREIEVLAPSRAAAASLELPVEWIEQLQALQPRYVVPSSCQFVQESWSWLNRAMFPITYRQFQNEVEAAVSGAKVVRLNPSVSVCLDKSGLQQVAPLSWVQPVGPQDVDYDYQVGLKAPTTAEISRQFAPLTAGQTERVFTYCRSGLLEKFRSMAASEEPYFQKPRLWRLSIYSHSGEPYNFFYRLDKGHIEPATEDSESLAWTTEIPVAKLFAALEDGESLTSMYIRINDTVFEPAIEDEIHSADIVEDPLIRCLFHGTFGSYQAAQLKRIRARG